MSLSKTSVRSLVREYFDLDSSDVSNDLLDRWTHEGWVRVVRKTPTWPGLLTEVTLSTVADSDDYPKSLRDVRSIYETATDGVLDEIDRQSADRMYPPPVVTGRPRHWAAEADTLFIYPTPDAVYVLRLTGYRAPTNPLSIPDGVTIDLPHEDAEPVLLNWVMAQCAKHEDEQEMAQTFRQEFAEGLAVLYFGEESAPVGTPIRLNSRSERSTRFDGEFDVGFR